MRKSPHFCLLLIALTLVVACVAATASSNRNAGSFALQDCQLSAPGMTSRYAAQCGTLTVFEDRSARSGRQIDLRIAVLPATGNTVAPDPLFLLADGPGQAATEAFLPVLSAFERINHKRDIVLVDQRGTGKSHPLRCPQSPQDLATLPDDTTRRRIENMLEPARRRSQTLHDFHRDG